MQFIKQNRQTNYNWANAMVYRPSLPWVLASPVWQLHGQGGAFMIQKVFHSLQANILTSYASAFLNDSNTH